MDNSKRILCELYCVNVCVAGVKIKISLFFTKYNLVNEGIGNIVFVLLSVK